MGWSLGYNTPIDSDLIDNYLLAVGKALFLATAYEHKCRFVLRIAKLANHYETTGDASATAALIGTIKDQLLCPTIKELSGLVKSSIDLDVLLKAKDARNFIAHECADIGALWSVRPKHIHQHLDRLRQNVLELTAGDNIISKWVYEIEEKEAAPKGMISLYPQLVEKWIFGEDVS
ncbi:MAG: hypothetical protein QM811_04465 [Pirellulales bacterium]